MKKIALVVDKDNWAFANTAKILKKKLAKYYEIDIIILSYLGGNLVQFFLIAKDYDLVHFLWREPLNNLTKPFLEEYIYILGSSKDQFLEEYVDFKKISTAVYDHLCLDKNIDVTKFLFNNISNYYVSSNKLLDIYNNLDIKYKPKMVITDGVDLQEFYPCNLERFDDLNRPIIIGWVGNSKWSEFGEDVKGLRTILNPAIDELKAEGYNIKTNYADSNIKLIPHNKMVNYYNSIDILVCSSTTEGTPNPVLEAMACGVPIISTDVGIVTDALGIKGKKYILEDRTVECMKSKIRKLLDNPKDFKILSMENTKQIRKWTWDIKAKDFKKFFDNCLKEDE